MRTAWNKGLKGYTNGGTYGGNELHPGWKGDKVGYSGVHKWIVRHYGRAEFCVWGDHPATRYNWANVSHEYTRERDDWLPMCPSCHWKYDSIINGLINRQISGNGQN